MAVKTLGLMTALQGLMGDRLDATPVSAQQQAGRLQLMINLMRSSE